MQFRLHFAFHSQQRPHSNAATDSQQEWRYNGSVTEGTECYRSNYDAGSIDTASAWLMTAVMVSPTRSRGNFAMRPGSVTTTE